MLKKFKIKYSVLCCIRCRKDEIVQLEQLQINITSPDEKGQRKRFNLNANLIEFWQAV